MHFDDVYSAHAGFVFRTLIRFGISRADAPDATQQVFIVVHRQLSSFDERSASMKSWLFGMCRRVAADHRAKASVRREVATEHLPHGEAEPQQERAVERKQARVLLQRLLDGLDEAKRDVFVLYELEGMTMPEVARTLGIPAQTAYSRYNAACRDMQNAAQPELREEALT